MNLLFTPRGQDHDIETNQDPEAVNLNFQALYRELQRLKAQLQAYQVDLAGSDVTGKIPPSRLGGTTPPDITKFYREDGIFAPVSSGGGSSAGSFLSLPPFRRAGWSQINTNGKLDVGCATTFGGGGTAAVTWDATGYYQDLFGVNAIGNEVHWWLNNNFTFLDHLPLAQFRFRTYANVTNIRFWATLSQSSPGNNDSFTSNGIAFRYSTVAGDTGFVPLVKGSGPQTLGTPIGAFTAATQYNLEIKMTSLTSATFTVYSAPNSGVSPLTLAGTTTMAIPADALGRSLGMTLMIYTTDANSKGLGFNRLYFEAI